MLLGVPAGASTPYQVVTSKSRRPGFGDRRHVGQRARALRRDQRERAQLAGLDVRRGRRDADEDEVHVAGEHVLHREVHALVGDVNELRAGDDVEELAREVVRGAGAARAEVERAGLGFREGDELLQVLRRQRRLRDHHVRHRRDQAHRREVLHRVVVDLRVQRRADGERRRDQHDGVAVGRRPRRRLGADVAAGAAAVLGHHRLAEARRQPLGDQPAEDVGAAAGRERQDEADRARGPGVLRLCQCEGKCKQRRRGAVRMLNILAPRVFALS